MNVNLLSNQVMTDILFRYTSLFGAKADMFKLSSAWRASGDILPIKETFEEGLTFAEYYKLRLVVAYKIYGRSIGNAVFVDHCCSFACGALDAVKDYQLAEWAADVNSGAYNVSLWNKLLNCLNCLNR